MLHKLLHGFIFFYRTKAWEELFTDALKRTSFKGVTGPVLFKGNSRRGNIVIKQIIRKSIFKYYANTIMGWVSLKTKLNFLK